MAQRLFKTVPDYLKSGAVVDSDVLMHPIAQSKKTGNLYKTTNRKTEKAAQEFANIGNKPINWADREHNIHQKLPQQWNYKTPAQQAKAMLNDPELKQFTRQLYDGLIPDAELDATFGKKK